MKYTLLSQKEIENRLLHLTEWHYVADIPALRVEFKFNTFLQAIEFMYQARTFIDTVNHHPEWTNAYNKINITLYTHEVKAVTDWDITLANYLSELYRKL